jgi:hypothetical protein
VKCCRSHQGSLRLLLQNNMGCMIPSCIALHPRRCFTGQLEWLVGNWRQESMEGAAVGAAAAAAGRCVMVPLAIAVGVCGRSTAFCSCCWWWSSCFVTPLLLLLLLLPRAATVLLLLLMHITTACCCCCHELLLCCWCIIAACCHLQLLMCAAKSLSVQCQLAALPLHGCALLAIRLLLRLLLLRLLRCQVQSYSCTPPAWLLPACRRSLCAGSNTAGNNPQTPPHPHLVPCKL